MNKKGFTLVELLAVIAILAILVIIALPNVLGMFNNAKKNTFMTEVQTIFKQAQTDFVKDSIETTGPKVYCTTKNFSATTDGNVECTSENALELTTTKNYYVSMTSSGAINYIVVNDGSYVYFKSGSDLKVTDLKDNDTDLKEFASGLVKWEAPSGSTAKVPAWK